MIAMKPVFLVMIVTHSAHIKDTYMRALSSLIPDSMELDLVWCRCGKRALMNLLDQRIGKDEGKHDLTYDLILAVDAMEITGVGTSMNAMGLDPANLRIVPPEKISEIATILGALLPSRSAA